MDQGLPQYVVRDPVDFTLDLWCIANPPVEVSDQLDLVF